MQINWREKYRELKLKVKELSDLSFRLGVEEGMRQAQQQQQQQDQADQQAQLAAQAGGQPGQPGQPGGQPGEESGQEPGQPDQNGVQTGGSELDSHISELESMLQKMEKDAPEYAALSKSLNSLRSFNDGRKAKDAINAISKSLKKPFSISAQAHKNMNEPAKKALGLQEQLVGDIMKGWADEEKKVVDQVSKTISIEGMLFKKD